MMRQYYYTVNSLPHLSFDKPLPIKKEEFFAITQIELGTNDLHALRSVGLCPLESEGKPLCVVKRWYDWEREVRNTLVRLRAMNLGLDQGDHMRADHHSPSSRVAEDVFQVESPLAAEEILDKARWVFLEELESDHYFDIERLVIYFLKLRILERRSFFDNKKGREILSAVMGQVDSIWNHGGKTEFTDE